jgi:sugar (pentulose or hexulose) kinase
LIGDAELVGSMVIARTALGDFPSFADAARQLVTIGETYDPDTMLDGLYADLFDRYRATYRNLRETWRK